MALDIIPRPVSPPLGVETQGVLSKRPEGIPQWGNLLLEAAINCEKNGVHICLQRRVTVQHLAIRHQQSVVYEFYGTYYAKVTDFGKWIRCTTSIPAYASMLSKINLRLDWIAPATTSDKSSDSDPGDWGRLKAINARGRRGACQDRGRWRRWIVVGSDQYLRSPASIRRDLRSAGSATGEGGILRS